MKYLLSMLILFVSTQAFAATGVWSNCNGSHTPGCDKVMKQESLSQRIQQLEQERVKLEGIYREILVRIDELKRFMNPEEPAGEQPKEDK